MTFEMSLLESVFDMTCSAFERCQEALEEVDFAAFTEAREVHDGCAEFHAHLKNGGLIQ